MEFCKSIFSCCYPQKNDELPQTTNNIPIVDNAEQQIENKGVDLDSIEERKVKTKTHYFYQNIEITKLELKNTKHIGKVISIYDADTITVILDFLNHPFIVKLRLYGIDTPEMKPLDTEDENLILKEKALAILGKVWLQNEINNNNNLVYLETKGPDKYGRTLANIYLDKEYTICLNKMLIDYYLADEYYGKTKQKEFHKHYLNLQKSKKIVNFYMNNNKAQILPYLEDFLKDKIVNV